MLKRTQLRTYKVELLCDECRNVMEYLKPPPDYKPILGGKQLSWLHRCPNCRHEQRANRIYPHIELIPVGKLVRQFSNE